MPKWVYSQVNYTPSQPYSWVEIGGSNESGRAEPKSFLADICNKMAQHAWEFVTLDKEINDFHLLFKKAD